MPPPTFSRCWTAWALSTVRLSIRHFAVEEGRPWHDKIPGLHGKNLFIEDRKGGAWLCLPIRPSERTDDEDRRATGQMRYARRTSQSDAADRRWGAELLNAVG
jgi:hypothetical protein